MHKISNDSSFTCILKPVSRPCPSLLSSPTHILSWFFFRLFTKKFIISTSLYPSTMATCSSLHRFFENPLPENPTLIESLASWNQIKSIKPIQQNSFMENLGELHFKEKPELKSPFLSPGSSPVDRNHQPKIEILSSDKNPSLDSMLGPCSKIDDCFSPKNLESLQLCTEGLGFESSDKVEDSKNEIGENWINSDVKEKPGVLKQPLENLSGSKRLKTGGGFPPPISCIGRSGKPWVSFRSYRHDGRFVLREIRLPTQELLQACREDGRLTLHFVQHDKEISEEREESDEQQKEDDADEQIREEEEEDANEAEISDISKVDGKS